MKYFLLIIFCFGLLVVSYADSTSILAIDTTKLDSFITKKDSVAVKDSIEANFLVPPLSIPRTHASELWIFIACCFTFFLAGLNRRINEKKHDQSILGFMHVGLLGQATDRSFYEFNIHQLIGLAVHNLVLSFWAYYFLRGTDYQFVENTLLFFILLFFLISIIYLCKFFFQYLALNILQILDLPILLVKCTIGLGYFTTLLTLPLFMVIYYIQYPEWHDSLVLAFLIIMLIYLLFRAFKFLQLFIQFFGSSTFYNILYFCALELIPLLVFIKIGWSIF